MGKKRAIRAKFAVPTRSSAGRYNTDTAPRPTDVKGLTLYLGPQTSGVTTQTVSKKAARKLERNRRHVQRRKEADAATQVGSMDIDMDSVSKAHKKQKAQTHLDKVKQALWTAVEDANTSGMSLDTSGEGTTIGIQAF